jgi:predicted enzyme related to lactoylglutathione lyase
MADELRAGDSSGTNDGPGSESGHHVLRKSSSGGRPQPWDKDPSYTIFSKGGPQYGRLDEAARRSEGDGHAAAMGELLGTPDVDATSATDSRTWRPGAQAAARHPRHRRFAIVGDPEGAIFAAFTPSQVPPVEPKVGIGDFSWHELVTTDWEASWNFYEQAVRLGENRRDGHGGSGQISDVQ